MKRMRLLAAGLFCWSSFCGIAGQGVPSTAIAKNNNPIEDESAWGPREQLKILRNLRRDQRRSRKVNRKETRLERKEDEIRKLKSLQYQHRRAIARLQQQIIAIQAELTQRQQQEN